MGPEADEANQQDQRCEDLHGDDVQLDQAEFPPDINRVYERHWYTKTEEEDLAYDEERILTMSRKSIFPTTRKKVRLPQCLH